MSKIIAGRGKIWHSVVTGQREGQKSDGGPDGCASGQNAGSVKTFPRRLSTRRQGGAPKPAAPSILAPRSLCGTAGACAGVPPAREQGVGCIAWMAAAADARRSLVVAASMPRSRHTSTNKMTCQIFTWKSVAATHWPFPQAAGAACTASCTTGTTGNNPTAGAVWRGTHQSVRLMESNRGLAAGSSCQQLCMRAK